MTPAARAASCAARPATGPGRRPRHSRGGVTVACCSDPRAFCRLSRPMVQLRNLVGNHARGSCLFRLQLGTALPSAFKKFLIFILSNKNDVGPEGLRDWYSLTEPVVVSCPRSCPGLVLPRVSLTLGPSAPPSTRQPQRWPLCTCSRPGLTGLQLRCQPVLERCSRHCSRTGVRSSSLDWLLCIVRFARAEARPTQPSSDSGCSSQCPARVSRSARAGRRAGT